ncbi:hypothetical protein DEJ23_10000 [Curtobacterium sp. MCSS17_008]|uniref:putative Ig domain-containing protein n=1 Tax=Curtobacterium sp. MCSS17_008 TaxID=2175647 RepID=UPI000DA899C0|nr:putative Ig domain-containing protein [Curtobacterium sp. MCSS17_008]PZF56492.1 hypothetical protein DEJ23_10000 [Curtobacterium sp. MCSS17_008]
MRRSTSTVRRACAVGTTIALVGLTTGLGIMTASTASAAPAEVTTSETAAATTGGQASTGAPATDGGQTTTDGQQPADGQAPAGSDATADTGDGSTGEEGTAGSTPDGAAEPTATEPNSTEPTGTDTPGADAPTTDAPVSAEATDPAVAIVGDAKVGSTLEAKPTGFDEDGAFKYVWTIANEPGAAPLAKVDSLTLGEALAGKKVTVTVTGTPADGSPVRTTSATSETITQTPVFVDESGEPITEGADIDDPQYIDATAGEQFSYTFHADGFPAPTYQLAWYYDDEELDGTVVSTKAQELAQRNAFGAIGVGWEADEGDEDDFGPEVQLPEGFTFDATTGVLSGTTELASWYDFAVTATSGDVTTKQYVELTVNPGVAAGFAVTAADQASLESREPVLWIITPEGDIMTIRLEVDENGDLSGVSERDGGRPTVQQGGTLLVVGQPVDRFGNYVEDYDEEGSPLIVQTVTSDVASDVIKPYDEAEGGTSVTFPHASIHTLTVSAASLRSTSFAVEVVPTAGPAVVAPTTPVAAAPAARPTTGRLAYTGADETAPLAWALGLLVAGAGLVGARTLRRRARR